MPLLRTSHDALVWSAALLTAAAAAIHFAVTPAHFDEDWTFGVFFAAAAWAQLFWALLVTHAGDRPMLLSGAAGNVAIALVWLLSRTTGLPVGPDAGARESVEFIDLLATASEILAAVMTTVALRSHARAMSRGRVSAVIVAVGLIIVPLTTVAIASSAGGVHS